MKDADLELLLTKLGPDPRLAVVGPSLQRPDGSTQRPAWPFPSVGNTWREALGLHRLARRAPTEMFVVGACFLVRRAAFDAVGGFDERYWLYGEEADLCRRLLDAGWRCEVVPDATAVHVGGASGGDSNRDVVFEHFQRGTERFIEQRQGRRGLVLHRLGVLVGSLLRLPFLLLLPGRAEVRATRVAMIRRLARVRTKPVPDGDARLATEVERSCVVQRGRPPLNDARTRGWPSGASALRLIFAAEGRGGRGLRVGSRRCRRPSW